MKRDASSLLLTRYETFIIDMRVKMSVIDVTAPEEHTIDWLKSKNLLKTQVDYSKCDTSPNCVPKKEAYVWRCPRRGCQNVISARGKLF